MVINGSVFLRLGMYDIIIGKLICHTFPIVHSVILINKDRSMLLGIHFACHDIKRWL